MITMKTLEEAPLQAIFDQVCVNLLKQNAKSRRIAYEGGRTINVCVYRDEHGHRCGAGWIISDDEYAPSMENKSFISVYSDFLGVSKDVLNERCMLVQTLQRLHDEQEVCDWHAQMHCIARNKSFNTHAIDTTVPA